MSQQIRIVNRNHGAGNQIFLLTLGKNAMNLEREFFSNNPQFKKAGLRTGTLELAQELSGVRGSSSKVLRLLLDAPETG